MLPLLRAVLVWAVILVTVILPRLEPPAAAVGNAVAVTQLSAYDRLSVVQQARTQRVQAAQMAQVRALLLQRLRATRRMSSSSVKTS